MNSGAAKSATAKNGLARLSANTAAKRIDAMLAMRRLASSATLLLPKWSG